MSNPRLHAIQYCPEEIVSFAQNLEDVLIFRAFGGSHSGTYLDIGAGHPIADNVTFWLKKSGWSGINIDPNPIMFGELCRYRPTDINLNLGVAAKAGEMLFFHVQQNEVGHGWGLSSFDPKAEELALSLNLKVERIQVPVKTLRQIVEELRLSAVDLLKIDVEGLEGAILGSTDWWAFRPRLICVEAVYPTTARPSWPEWEHHLTQADYRFALFDGVNAYYAPAEQADVIGQLTANVNCSDRWRRPTDDEFNCAPP